jgi:A/G-specific adenine glycosylase
MTRRSNFCDKKMQGVAKSSAISVSGENAARSRRALLRWYDQNRRDLPWRHVADPYAIWLSEIMLQQTRVAAVLEHYRIFLERFPNIEALAAASEDAVLALWSGLGYYRRARMLHQCARELVAQHDSRFPEKSEVLRDLPGIGRYTAAAIASIAFAEPVAVVDGNVERVLQRLTRRRLTSPQCWKIAQEFLSKSRPGDFNQAMMELGANVCLPRGPRCASCPIRRWCRTQGEITQAQAPLRQKRREIWCALERRNGHVRLVKRPDKASLMAGMWELPQWEELPGLSASQAQWRTFRHSITVTDYKVHVLRDWDSNRNLKGGFCKGPSKWVPIHKIPELPITGLTRKILKADGII